MLSALTTVGALLISGTTLYYSGRSLDVSRKQTEAALAQADAAQKAQSNERFQAAIEGLGSESREVRLGAVYSLGRIARETPTDLPTILGLASAFIRRESVKNAPARDDGVLIKEPYEHPLLWHPRGRGGKFPEWTSPQPDVQAALTLLGSRPASDKTTIDLSGLYLFGADLRGLNLDGVVLSASDLGWVDATGASLSKARLDGADIDRSILDEADMSGADLSGAIMDGTTLVRTNAKQSRMNYAKMRHALLFQTSLAFADLEGADLRRAYSNTANKVSEPDFESTYLGRADLRQSDLGGAVGFDAQSLECAAIDGATLPSSVNSSQADSKSCGTSSTARFEDREYLFRSKVTPRWSNQPAVNGSTYATPWSGRVAIGN